MVRVFYLLMAFYLPGIPCSHAFLEIFFPALKTTSKPTTVTTAFRNITRLPMVIHKYEPEDKSVTENIISSSECMSSTAAANTGQEIDEFKATDCIKKNTTTPTSQLATNQTVMFTPSNSSKTVPTSKTPTTTTNTTSTTHISNSSSSTTISSTNITTKLTKPFPGLEIDESKNRVEDQEGIINFLNEFADVVERPIITVTKTIMKPITKIITVNPYCIKLQDVTGFCGGNIKVLQPISNISALGPDQQSKNEVEGPYGTEREKKVTMNPTVIPTPTTTLPTTTSTSNPGDIPFVYDVFDVSNYDYEVEEVPEVQMKVAAASTPLLNRIPRKVVHSHSTHFEPSPDLQSLMEPNIKFVTLFVSSTVVQYSTDFSNTISIIASQCLPRELGLPTCS